MLKKESSHQHEEEGSAIFSPVPTSTLHLFFFLMQGMELRASCVLGKCSTREPHLQLNLPAFFHAGEHEVCHHPQDLAHAVLHKPLPDSSRTMSQTKLPSQ